MADWTEASGYTPTRVDALQDWPDTPLRPVIEQISYSAWLVPSEDILSAISPALRSAVTDVLTGRSDPSTAAQAAIQQINQP
jgi:maltose-binding protein MalE